MPHGLLTTDISGFLFSLVDSRVALFLGLPVASEIPHGVLTTEISARPLLLTTIGWLGGWGCGRYQDHIIERYNVSRPFPPALPSHRQNT